ncbi:hypothetical protein [Oligosphaera ethanolica]|uniref:Uncharacterized protein n=1 Tax=Oligosphaera ethanolica TaxID=760260 RepID=A0AAE3VIB9_9BACT|nr:hypothetical protein [Oligosphaera ethanolica]MDQ0290999.1 hypothetical protein [Oligosphaera ethanolica]
MSEYKNIEAYDGRTGRQIRLPANGRVALNAGDIVRVNGGEFLTLAGATVIVKVTVREGYETEHLDRLEEVEQ